MVKCTEDRAASATRRLADPAALDDLIVPNGHRPLHSTDHPPPGGAAGGSVYGFRLCPGGGGGGGGDSGSVGERESATSASVYSFYKQRIDAMFDETRSQLSGAGGGGGGGGGGVRRMSDHAIYHRLESEEEQRQRRINNSVQARIERMFSEMAKSGDLNMMRNLSQAKAIACNRFGVDYLGSVALHDKVTSLQGLQRPLSDLYFAYCRLREGAGGGEEEPSSGTLEISGCGLKVHHGGGPDQTELEQLNPFPTIAVWAAVKFVSRRRSEDGALEYAFLPLIADPDAIDKGALFRPLNPADQRAVEAAAGASAADIDPSYNHHSPLFAVVMRKLGVSRQLECHGFVCACSEDAIVIAANLYQALMAFMQTRNHGKHGKQSAHATKGPRNKNGVSYVSLASSSVAGDAPDVRSILSGRDERALPVRKHLKEALSNGSAAPPKLPPKTNSPEPKDTIPLPKRSPSIKIPPPVPVRPPRRKTKSSTSSASEDSEEPIVIQKGLPPKQPKSPPPMENGGRSKDPSGDAPSRIRHNRSESEPCTGTVGVAVQQGPLGVRRTASDLHGYNNTSTVLPPFGVDSYEGGDILTKVAIPRSRSFLNAGGPLTRYGRRQSMGPGYGPGGFEGGGGGGGNGSPLGFKELFAEFRVQEGLNSMDDILNAIIDAEGMSFNDLKPIYKEFLLKLAVTLTKDELYQRSKSIMRRQRKKMNRRKGGGCVNRKKSFSSGGGGIKRVFRRSVNKLKQSKSRPQSFEFTSVLFPSSVPLRASKKIRNGGFSVESTTTSTSSYSARNFHLQRQPGGGASGAGTQGVRVGISRALRLPRRLSSASSAKRRQRDAPARKRSQAHSASEDSDFFSLARASAGGGGAGGGGGSGGGGSGSGGHHSREHSGAAASSSTALAHQNRSSSGYFSCSECSYDSESCTCTSADKCYCSLGEGKSKAKSQGKRSGRGKATPTPSPPAPAPAPPGPGPRDRTLSSCGCDTDSCLDSDKCYCSLQEPAHHHHRHGSKRSPGHAKPPAPAAASVFDQLKQRGFAVSESSVSRAPSPSWQQQQRRHSHAHSTAGSVRAAKSLEALEATSAAAAARAKHPLLHTRRTRSDESSASGGCGFNRNRMDVYAPAALPSGAGTPSAYASFRGAAPAAPSAPSRRSYSSDNLVVDYDLFTTSSRSEAEEEDAAAARAQASRLAAEGRVLVVSARDPRGRIIYMGASCRSDAGSRRGGGPLAPGGSVRVPSVAAVAPELHAGGRRRRRASAAAAAAAAASASEALSVKKSAEIAAVFSDMKAAAAAAAAAGGVAPGDDYRVAAVADAAAHGKDMFYSGVPHSDYYFASRTSTKSYLGSSLENSLGYLP